MKKYSWNFLEKAIHTKNMDLMNFIVYSNEKYFFKKLVCFTWDNYPDYPDNSNLSQIKLCTAPERWGRFPDDVYGPDKFIERVLHMYTWMEIIDE